MPETAGLFHRIELALVHNITQCVACEALEQIEAILGSAFGSSDQYASLMNPRTCLLIIWVSSSRFQWCGCLFVYQSASQVLQVAGGLYTNTSSRRHLNQISPQKFGLTFMSCTPLACIGYHFIGCYQGRNKLKWGIYIYIYINTRERYRYKATQ